MTIGQRRVLSERTLRGFATRRDEYIHRCHLRVARHIEPAGRYLLDAGSGPVQYPEYLDYARGYRFRVCADISITALLEARKRLGENGLYVVADISSLPFKAEVFEGLVSLHTIHHLPEEEHLLAYAELYRVLAAQCRGVVVNGWPSSHLMKAFEPAGFPCVDFRATVDDGSYHAVDSSEMAFKIAGSMALRKAVQDAKPVLLEPIMKVEVITPDDTLGAVIGDLNSKRGRVQGVEPQAGGNQKINAQVPMSEMLTYANQLTSLTSGRGLYSMEFSQSEELPRHLTQKIIAEREAHKKEKAEEK